MSTGTTINSLLAAIELHAAAEVDDIAMRIVLMSQMNAALDEIKRSVSLASTPELLAMRKLAIVLEHIYKNKFSKASCEAHVDDVRSAAVDYLTAVTAKYN